MTDQIDIPQQPEDLANYMDRVFVQMEEKFTEMTDQVLSKTDFMSQRLNELKTSIETLMQQPDSEHNT